MDAKTARRYIAASCQQISEAIQQCKDGDFGDPAHTALAVSIIEELFSEVKELLPDILPGSTEQEQ